MTPIRPVPVYSKSRGTRGLGSSHLLWGLQRSSFSCGRTCTLERKNFELKIFFSRRFFNFFPEGSKYEVKKNKQIILFKNKKIITSYSIIFEQQSASIIS
jgi:hypothetical protein